MQRIFVHKVLIKGYRAIVTGRTSNCFEEKIRLRGDAGNEKDRGLAVGFARAVCRELQLENPTAFRCEAILQVGLFELVFIFL